MVNWPAQMCCMSFPASVCDKELKATTPCLHDQDTPRCVTCGSACAGAQRETERERERERVHRSTNQKPGFNAMMSASRKHP